MKYRTHYLYFTGDILPLLRRERDLDLEGRDADGESSMSSSTSEEIDWNLFPVTRVFCLVCTVGVVFIFSFTVLRFTGDDGLSVTVLADFVSTEGFLTSSESGVNILSGLHAYVPSTPDHNVLKILCYGDGLSCERHNDAHKARANGASTADRLEGLVRLG